MRKIFEFLAYLVEINKKKCYYIKKEVQISNDI